MLKNTCVLHLTVKSDRKKMVGEDKSNEGENALRLLCRRTVIRKTDYNTRAYRRSISINYI